jgi:hypothetical protein
VRPRTNANPHTQDVHVNFDPQVYHFPNRGDPWVYKQAKARCTDSDKYIDISYFPGYFDTMDEACDYYNEHAVRLNMQVRKANYCKGLNGLIQKFSLVCVVKQPKARIASLGVNVKTARTDCNYQIDFKWNDNRNGFCRGFCNWQHSHDLVVTKHNNFVKNASVIREMKVYAEVDIPPA